MVTINTDHFNCPIEKQYYIDRMRRTRKTLLAEVLLRIYDHNNNNVNEVAIRNTTKRHLCTLLLLYDRRDNDKQRWYNNESRKEIRRV